MTVTATPFCSARCAHLAHPTHFGNNAQGRLEMLAYIDAHIADPARRIDETPADFPGNASRYCMAMLTAPNGQFACASINNLIGSMLLTQVHQFVMTKIELAIQPVQNKHAAHLTVWAA